MNAIYNAYVLRVTESMTSLGKIPLAAAKRRCRQNLPFLEKSYSELTKADDVARELLAN
jgi:hypothetical protein